MKKIRQMRGPGMNKGLKKPRHGKFYEPGADEEKKSRKPEASDDALPSSYLSDTLVPGGRKRRARKGKVISSTIF